MQASEVLITFQILAWVPREWVFVLLLIFKLYVYIFIHSFVYLLGRILRRTTKFPSLVSRNMMRYYMMIMSQEEAKGFADTVKVTDELHTLVQIKVIQEGPM